MGVFRNLEVFDPDFIPDVVRFREKQIEELKSCIQPVVEGYSPLNAMCVGPPATGKTLTIRLLTSELDNVAYVRCLKYRDPFLIYSKICRDLLGIHPPSGGKSKAAIINKVWEKMDSPAIIVLDDLNFLKPSYASEVLYEILKAPEEWGIKVGIIAASTDRMYPVYLDPFASSLFHYLEVHYPLYSGEEVREILRWRVEHGFEEGAITEEAFERVVEITIRSGDLRYGIYLLRAAGLLAGREGRVVTVEYVERAHIGDAAAYIGKLIAALNSDERVVLRIIYTADDITAGTLYKVVHEEVRMSYRRFYDILEKLERLGLIGVVMARRGKGWTRKIVRKYDVDVVKEVLG